ncbi:hypothetical protein EBQ90_02165 [bacterium]|nr:hypothetical protein [bacterium]
MKPETIKKQLWGMVHVGPLPGTPRFKNDWESTLEKAVAEAELLKRAGFAGILFENMHDVPYLKGNVGPEITAAMAVLGAEIKKATQLELGVQILAGAYHATLAVAQAVAADWMRVEGFVFAHVADEGLFEACAGPLLRLRKELGAENIKIMADIKKKHSSHSLTADIDVVETAKAAEFFGADAVVLTGTSTGKAASEVELEQVKQAVTVPVFIGSGITETNLSHFKSADGWIVGSSLKEKGQWQNAIQFDAASRLVKAFHALSKV